MMPLAIGLPLFANGLDWLETLLPILFFLFWILAQLVGVVKKVVGGGARPQPQRQPPPIRKPRPVAVDGVGRGDLQDEIREFLRRESPDRRPAMPSPATSTPPPRPPRPRPAPQLVERSKEMPKPMPSRVSGESIAERVKQDFSKELEHLSTPLTADRALASSPPSGRVTSGSPAAAEIVRSLRSPATLRELVVIREILDRPVDRW